MPSSLLSSNITVQLFSLPDTMKAIVLEQPNEHIELINVNLPLPECNESEILVKVESVGLNPLDALFAKTGFCKWQYPHVLGLDAVGVVVQANKGVSPGIGERVMWHASLAEQGVLSEYAKVPNFAVSILPDNVTSNTAATIPCAGMSALIALEKTKVIEGDNVFIEAGAGAVGQFAIQFAKQRGATVFTSVSKRNVKLVKRLGADEVFDYEAQHLTEKISQAVGPQGFDVVIDSIGGDTTIRNIELMRFCGRIACLRSLPIFPDELMFRKAPSISIVSLGGAWLSNSLCAQQRMAFMKNVLLEGVARGEIVVPEVSLVDFDAGSISAALNVQINGGFTGKQVVEIA